MGNFDDGRQKGRRAGGDGEGGFQNYEAPQLGQ